MNTSISLPSALPTRNLLSHWVERLGVCFLCLTPIMAFMGTGLADIAISGTAILFLVRSVLSQDYGFLRLAWLRLAIVLWGYLLLMSCFTHTPALAFRESAPFLRFPLFAAAMQCWLLCSTQYRRYFMIALGAGAVFIVVNTLFAYVTGLNITGRVGLQGGVAHTFHWVWERTLGGTYQRLQGINGKLNTGTILTWMVFPFIALLFERFQSSDGAQRVFAALAVVGIGLAVMLTGERMAFLELGLGFALFFFLLPRLRGSFVILLLLLFTLMVGVMFFNPAVFHRVIGSVLHQTAGLKDHNVYAGIFGYALRLFEHHPWTGVGLKQFSVLCHAGLYQAPLGCNTHAQNMYLEWLSGAGLIGTGLFLAMLFYWVRRFWSERAVLLAAPIAVGALIDVVLRLWPFASTTSFFFSWGSLGFWLMAGFLLGYLDEQKKSEEQSA